jgi:hypothetical protein
VAGADDVHRRDFLLPDHAVEVRVEQVEARGRAPVPEQPGLYVLRSQRLAQQRIVEQIDLPDGQVVRRPPTAVEQSHVSG